MSSPNVRVQAPFWKRTCKTRVYILTNFWSKIGSRLNWFEIGSKPDSSQVKEELSWAKEEDGGSTKSIIQLQNLATKVHQFANQGLPNDIDQTYKMHSKHKTWNKSQHKSIFEVTNYTPHIFMWYVWKDTMCMLCIVECLNCMMNRKNGMSGWLWLAKSSRKSSDNSN